MSDIEFHRIKRLPPYEALPAKVGSGFAVRQCDHIKRALPAKVGSGFAVRQCDNIKYVTTFYEVIK